MGHYFTNNENLKSNLRSIEYAVKNTSFVFYTDNGVFSKSNVDYGTDLLINTYLSYGKKTGTVLDVGCGYGVIGITVNKINNQVVEQIDINKRALHLTEMNNKRNKTENKIYESNIYEQITKKYDVIITNPPIRAGKKIYMTMLREAYKYLLPNGELWFVARKDQGAKTIEKELRKNYNINLIEKQRGYYIYKANCVDKLKNVC